MKGLGFALVAALGMLVGGKAIAQSPSFAEIAAELKNELTQFNTENIALEEELADIQKADFARMEASGKRIKYVSFGTYKNNQAQLNAGIGREYDGIAVYCEPSEAQTFYSAAQQTGYQEHVLADGTVSFSASGGCGQCANCRAQVQQPTYCQPCPPVSQSYCDNGPCVGAREFQQYNSQRPMGQRIFGPGYDGRTFGSTWRAAPIRPYLFTHAFDRLDNPKRFIGEGRLFDVMFPRIRYKNGHICTEHDMKVHLGRRQWIAIIAGTAGAGGAGAAAGGGGGGGGAFLPFLIL